MGNASATICHGPSDDAASSDFSTVVTNSHTIFILTILLASRAACLRHLRLSERLAIAESLSVCEAAEARTPEKPASINS